MSCWVVSCSKPLAAICPVEKPPKKGGKPRDLSRPPRRKPVLALFNQAFCDLLQYQAVRTTAHTHTHTHGERSLSHTHTHVCVDVLQHELQGSSIAHFMLPDPDPEVHHHFMSRMMARSASTHLRLPAKD